MSEAVLITGVGRRLGYLLAEHFLAQGRQVIGTYRTLRDEIRVLEKQGAELLPCDFYNKSEIDALIARVREKHTSLRALIHNASDWVPDAQDEDDPSAITRMMQIHVNAPYQLNRSLRGLLANSQNETADIIHVTDYISERGSQKHVAYAASKAALSNLTLSFAAKYAPEIKVNSIAPALLLFKEDDAEEYKIKTLKKSLMQKEGGAGEFIAAVEYLMQSGFVTGRTMALDGGRHIKT